jgi:hypothetical protein
MVRTARLCRSTGALGIFDMVIHLKASNLLRVGSILSLLLAIGHTSGGLSLWSPAGDTEVLRAMKSFHFDAGGVSRTYLDFFLGFGYILSVYLVMQAVILWQMASLAKSDTRRLRPLIGSLLFASIASAALSVHFIFWIPFVSNAAIAACLALALLVPGDRLDS